MEKRRSSQMNLPRLYFEQSYSIFTACGCWLFSYLLPALPIFNRCLFVLCFDQRFLHKQFIQCGPHQSRCNIMSGLCWCLVLFPRPRLCRSMPPPNSWELFTKWSGSWKRHAAMDRSFQCLGCMLSQFEGNIWLHDIPYDVASCRFYRQTKKFLDSNPFRQS